MLLASMQPVLLSGAVSIRMGAAADSPAHARVAQDTTGAVSGDVKAARASLEYAVQVGVYRGRGHAAAQLEGLRLQDPGALIVQDTLKGKTVYRVMTDGVSNREAARAMEHKLKRNGFDTYIV